MEMDDMGPMDLKAKPFYLTDEEMSWVEKTLAGMDERKKVGQLFCVMGNGFSEEEMDRLVTDYGIGAVLFRPLPADTLLEKFRRIDALAAVPLLKAANLEAGGEAASASIRRNFSNSVSAGSGRNSTAPIP